MMRRLAALFFLLALTGCSILPTADPQDIYTIPPASLPLADAMAREGETSETSRLADHSLRIRTPHTDRLTNSQRILVRPEAGQVQAYKGARWSDTPPRMVRDYLVQALRSHSRVAQVVSDETSVKVDRVMEIDLSVFRVDYVNERPVVRIQLDALLMDSVTHRVMGGKRFTVSQRVPGMALPEVVAGFGDAMARLSTELAGWLETLEYSQQ